MRAKKMTFHRRPPSHFYPWTAKDNRELRQLAGRYPLGKIAKMLHRTESAVRQHGYSNGVSFAMRFRG